MYDTLCVCFNRRCKSTLGRWAPVGKGSGKEVMPNMFREQTGWITLVTYFGSCAAKLPPWLAHFVAAPWVLRRHWHCQPRPPYDCIARENLASQEAIVVRNSIWRTNCWKCIDPIWSFSEIEFTGNKPLVNKMMSKIEKHIHGLVCTAQNKGKRVEIDIFKW